MCSLLTWHPVWVNNSINYLIHSFVVNEIRHQILATASFSHKYPTLSEGRLQEIQDLWLVLH